MSLRNKLNLLIEDNKERDRYNRDKGEVVD